MKKRSRTDRKAFRAGTRRLIAQYSYLVRAHGNPERRKKYIIGRLCSGSVWKRIVHAQYTAMYGKESELPLIPPPAPEIPPVEYAVTDEEGCVIKGGMWE